MKYLRLLSFLLASASAQPAICQESDPNSNSANTTAVFNAIYPDLASHQDVVTAATMSLTAEGFQAQTWSAIMQAVATRARTNLQRSSRNPAATSTTDAAAFKQQENAARDEAQRLFPEVATPGSALYQRVTQERANLERIYPDYFKNPNWPLMLTNGCIAALTMGSQEKKAQQQVQSNQGQMTVDQAKQALEVLRMLQDLKNSRTRR